MQLSRTADPDMRATPEKATRRRTPERVVDELPDLCRNRRRTYAKGRGVLFSAKLCVVDLERLLEPVPNGPPAGPDLDRAHDPEFLALETAARGKPEQQYGKTIIPAVEADWPTVRAKSEALLLRSKDLRVAVLLARALTRLENVEGLAAGLQLISEIISRYWDSVHPGLEDDDDATVRLYALAALGDQQTFLREVRDARFIASPQFGRVSVRDVLVAEGKLPPVNGTSFTSAQIAGMARDAAPEQRQALRAAIAGLESVKALETSLNERGVLTHEAAPDLRPLKDLLQPAAAVSAEALEDGDASRADTQAADTPTETTTATKESPAMVQNGQIASRDDVIRILDRVCEYMERTEPSSPAPLLIRRAQRLMSRSFVEIIQDLAPGSLSDIQKLAGPENKP